MPQTTVIASTPTQQNTCETCPKFKDYNDRERGLCTVFDQVTRRHHTLTPDCQRAIEAEQLKELLSNHQAFINPITKGFPGGYVFKQSLDYGFERIGYVGENLKGWFAQDQHGVTVVWQQPSRLKAVQVLLNR